MMPDKTKRLKSNWSPPPRAVDGLNIMRCGCKKQGLACGPNCRYLGVATVKTINNSIRKRAIIYEVHKKLKELT